MRIVDRKTFLDLPNNIVYCEFTPNLFGEYRIKTQTLTNDFCFDSLLDFNSLGWDSNCGWFDMYSESLKTGLAYTLGRMDESVNSPVPVKEHFDEIYPSWWDN